MAQNFAARKMAIGFAPVVVNTGAQLVLFDTGNGAARRPDAGRLASLLATAVFQPEQIDLVVLSHFHPDHIGGLVEEGQLLLPNARYVTAAAEYDFWSPQDRLSGPTERVATLVQANVVPLAEKTTFIKEGAEVVPGIEALAAFGHTPHMRSTLRALRAVDVRGHRETLRAAAAARFERHDMTRSRRPLTLTHSI
jgi:glyoxylase-like metal-dependent hydrolase (beta-lactamase superfamily II)